LRREGDDAALADQEIDEVAANEAGGAGDQDFLGHAI
jgi:hypothetical protein